MYLGQSMLEVILMPRVIPRSRRADNLGSVRSLGTVLDGNLSCHLECGKPLYLVSRWHGIGGTGRETPVTALIL